MTKDAGRGKGVERALKALRAEAESAPLHVEGALHQVEHEMERLREIESVARMIFNADWEGLFKWAEKHVEDPPTHRYWWNRTEELEWAGIHETDARHTCPNRRKLVRICLRSALNVGDFDD